MSEGERPLVLVVDDDTASVHVLATVLRPHYEVVVATNARRGLALARARRPDLVLLDVHLPDQHGYEVCRALKAGEETRAVPVLFLTASDDPAHEGARREAGAAETLVKPFDPAWLLARLQAHLAR